jgi:hypothetical protein
MSTGRYLMTRVEKADRRQRIIAMRLSGVAPYDIARKFGMTANYVRAVLREADVAAETAAYGSDVDSIWSLPEEERRLAFARRAAEGARAALRNPSFEFSPVSTVITATGTNEA